MYVLTDNECSNKLISFTRHSVSHSFGETYSEHRARGVQGPSLQSGSKVNTGELSVGHDIYQIANRYRLFRKESTAGITDELEGGIGDAVFNGQCVGDVRAGLDWGRVGILHEAS